MSSARSPGCVCVWWFEDRHHLRSFNANTPSQRDPHHIYYVPCRRPVCRLRVAGGIGGFLHSVTDAAKGAAQAVKNEIQADIKPSLKEDVATTADTATSTPAAPAK